MEPEAPVTVLKGFLATSSAGAVLGGSYAFVKRGSPMIFAVNSSVNSGIVGLTFFALREYVAGPVLVHTMPWQTYARRREQLQVEASGLPGPMSSRRTLSEIRTHKLLDTAIAGSVTGGILNAWKRGPRGLIPGAVTAGIIATVAQLAWNELEVARVKLVSKSNRSALLEPARPPERSRTFSEKLMDGLGVVLPVRKMSDEEYLQKLLKEREEVEKQLEEVHRSLEAIAESEDHA